MSNAGKLVKDMLKAKKESVMGKLGDSPYEDPMEPWSAKYAQPVKEESLNEDSLLIKYIKSLGFNPEFMSFAQRSSYARSNAFKTYKTGHTFDAKKQNLKTEDVKQGVAEEVEQIDEAGTGLLMSFIKSKGLNPLTMDGNQKKAYARSSEFRIFKMRHVKETSGMGERGDDWNEQEDKGIRQWDKPNFALSIKARQAKADKAKELQANTDNMQKKGIKPKNMKEEADVKDTVCMDIPLLIRVLEFIREDVKTDVELHNTVERLIDMRHDVPLTMEHYDSITGKLKESKDAGEYDYEGAMAKTLLQTICRNAEALKDMLEDDENLPEWVQSKITKAEDYITTSLDYMKSTEELDEDVEQIEELNKDTLYSYADKAEKDQDKQFNTIGKGMRDNNPKSANKAGHKFSMRSVGINRAEKRLQKEEQIDELSTDLLGRYKKAAGAQASDADKAGDYAKGNKRFSGIMKATRKQFDNDAKKVNELKNQDDNQELDSRITREEKKMKGADPCWKGYQMVGMKKKGGRSVPNCVPEQVTEGIGGIEDSPMSATNSVKAMESEQRKKNMKSARIIKSIYKKKGKNESMYDWEKDDKPNAKITLQGGSTMTGKPRDTVEIEPVLKTRPNSQKQ